MAGTITDAVNRGLGLQTHGHDKIVTLSSNVVLVERSCLVFEGLGKMTPCKKKVTLSSNQYFYKYGTVCYCRAPGS